MKATILDYRLVKSKIDEYKKEYDFSNNTQALMGLSVSLLLNLPEDEIKDGIIDGSGDKGLDGVYIVSDDDRSTVYLFQSKCYEAEEKFDRALEESALVKMQNAIGNYILKSPREIHGANRFLLDKLKDIKGLSNPKFCIVFCSNSNPPSNDAINEFDQFIKEKQGKNDYFKVEYLNLAELAARLAPEVTRNIETEIRLSGKYFDWSIGNARVVVGRMSGRRLAELRKNEGGELFDKNVRGYLTTKNEVNQQIFKTAISPTEAHNFFFLNNGVTIVCTDIDYLPVDESPEIKIKNLQIVNGGQTTNALYEAYQGNQLSDSVYILVRIVQTEDKNLLQEIPATTNNQTIVRARDLRSNDLIQRTIEEILLTKGFYYEARKDKYRNSPVAKGKRIDMEDAAQAYYAYIFNKPADAKNKKRDIFGSLYYEIFNDSTNPDDILIAFKTLEYIKKCSPEYRDKYSFVKYAEYHSIALLRELGVRALSDLTNHSIKEKYEKILKATDEVVKEEIEEQGDNYSHRALFIAPTTIGRVRESYYDLYKE